MSDIRAEVEVEVPVRTAYDQWTQFEAFPQFMDGVEEVLQVTETRIHWTAEIAGVRREWDAEIVEQRPDRVIAWRSVDGAENRGRVEFESLGPNRCRVRLHMHFEPEGVAEKVGDAVGAVDRRAERDLMRFKEFIEARGVESGAWRGRVGGEGESDVATTTPKTMMSSGSVDEGVSFKPGSGGFDLGEGRVSDFESGDQLGGGGGRTS